MRIVDASRCAFSMISPLHTERTLDHHLVYGKGTSHINSVFLLASNL